MKTLKDHTIFYDAACPMCNLYTRAFVQSGMLDENGRGTYQCLPAPLEPLINKEKAVNEIALVNKKTGQVHYGIDSMFLVIGHSIPELRPLFRWKPFHWFAARVYKFISYNRRQIIPAQHDAVGEAPAFNRKYRGIYLVFTWLVTAFILHRYSSLLQSLVGGSGFYSEFLICGGQMVWQGLIIYFINPGKTWDYLGNMMTISFAGAVLLIPMLIASSFIMLPAHYYAGYFLLVAGCMFLEHTRRMKILSLTWKLSATWVLYRVIILLIILYV